MKTEVLPIEHLKRISDTKAEFSKIGEEIMGLSAYTDILGSCLYLNDEFKGFKKCVQNSLNNLRDYEELYGFPEEEKKD